MQIAQLYISPAVAGLDVKRLESDINEYIFNLSKDNTGVNPANNVLSERLLQLPIDQMSPEVKKEVIELLSSLNNRINYGQPEQNKRAHKNIDSYIQKLNKPNVEDGPAVPRAMPAMAPGPMLDKPDVMGGRARKVSCGCRRGGKSRAKSRSKSRAKSRTGGKASRRGRPRSKLRRGK